MELFHAQWKSQEKSATFHEYMQKIKMNIDEKERQVFELNEEICEAYIYIYKFQ